MEMVLVCSLGGVHRTMHVDKQNTYFRIKKIKKQATTAITFIQEKMEHWLWNGSPRARTQTKVQARLKPSTGVVVPGSLSFQSPSRE